MKHAVAIAALAAVFFAVSPAPAQQRMCAPRDAFIAALAETYGEKPTAMGVTSNGKLLEVIVSPDGMWTIIETTPSGVSCVIAAGNGWHAKRSDPFEQDL